VITDSDTDSISLILVILNLIVIVISEVVWSEIRAIPPKSPVSATTTVFSLMASRADDILACLTTGSPDIMNWVNVFIIDLSCQCNENLASRLKRKRGSARPYVMIGPNEITFTSVFL